MTFPPSTLSTFLSAAVEAAQLGAAELERWRTKFSVKEKSRADLVTDADTASQRIVKEALLAAFPDHQFLGEEDSVGKAVEETRPKGDAPIWVVDPLDGTSNYVHDVPAYCVSIGLYAEGKPIVGVIHDPRQNEVFTAALGLGAFLEWQADSRQHRAESPRRHDRDRLPGQLRRSNCVISMPRHVSRPTRSRCAAPAQPRSTWPTSRPGGSTATGPTTTSPGT